MGARGAGPGPFTCKSEAPIQRADSPLRLRAILVASNFYRAASQAETA